MNNTTEFEAFVQVYFQLHPQEKKYESPENISYIVERMRSYGLSVVSNTMVLRAIQELLADGQIHRSDGGDESTDKHAAEVAERNRIAAIAARPLTEKDFNEFVRMTPAELEQKYFGSEEFRIRYDIACKQWWFRVPPKPAPSSDVPLEQDTSQWRDLDAKMYHSIPTSRIIQLYRSDAGFKRAVDRLIKTSQI